jgi:eukaryotic-like serine/threonine-protein kinase
VNDSTTGVRFGKKSGGGSSYGGVAPEIHEDACRRLSWLALIYSGTYTCVEAYGISTHSHAGPDHTLWDHAINLIPISIGFFLAWAARAGKITPKMFPRVLVAFQFISTFGIIQAAWGWETEIAKGMRELVVIGGANPDTFLARLKEHHIALVNSGDVPWVGVWILMVPLILPLSPRQTVIGSLLSASILPIYFAASLLAHGIPPVIDWWVWRFIADLSVPVFICAGIAIVGSRVLYGLTRQLSDARRMGSYQLEEKLGDGGMGEVWKARHRLLARPAAIKLIRPDALGSSDPEVVRTALVRFEREAQATSMLGSPHTIEIYDFGTTEDGSFYYVMELLDGLDLRTLIERYGPIPPNRAVHLLAQACHSLADAHESGLIHRDIKPANIFACRRGREEDFVKVLDFGLVKHADSKAVDVQLTTVGTTTGTPAFMAPEAVYEAERMDARSDLYALGCVGYWLVTGRLVFEHETPIQTLLSHLNDTPAPPSSVATQPIPEEFDRAIMDCLAKDPARRPASAEALGKRLQRSLGAMEPWTVDDARAWWTRVRQTLPDPGFKKAEELSRSAG